MPTTKPSFLSETLQQLEAVQKQQACFELSLQSIDSLKVQHREWQKSVENLLTAIQTRLNDDTIRIPVSKSLKVPAGDVTIDTDHDIESVHSTHSMPRLESGESVHSGPAAKKRPTRAGTLEELFRTRKTVVDTSKEPTGLKQMVQEEIVQTASEGKDERLGSWGRSQACILRVVDSTWFEQPGR